MTNNYILNKLSIQISIYLYPFYATSLFLYSLKSSENQRWRCEVKSLSTNPTRWSNTLKQFLGGWRLKGSEVKLWVLVFWFVLFNYRVEVIFLQDRRWEKLLEEVARRKEHLASFWWRRWNSFYTYKSRITYCAKYLLIVISFLLVGNQSEYRKE